MRFFNLEIFKSSYTIGLFTEIIISLYLRLCFYKILKRRYKTGNYTGRAEIDIIAKKGNLIIFVEVKYRKTLELALNSITENQKKRLIRAAETFLLQYYPTYNARFDLIALCPPKIFWIKNI